jgi:arylsulfatase A-like enzyme
MRGRLVLAGLVVAGLALGLVAVAAARGSGRAGDRAAQRPRPNVLVIVTDDARAETLAAMPKTRRWIGDAGVTFTNGFAPTPSCCPSRASIFSGRYVHNHGVLRQQLAGHLDQSTTLARYLKDAGYHTAMAGKFLNRWPLKTPPPGYDRYALANGGYYDQVWAVDGAVRRVPTYSTTFIGDQALADLDSFERDDATPWFAYLATFAPHDPRVPEPKYAKATFPELDKVGPSTVPPVTGKPRYLADRTSVSLAEAARVRTGQLRTLLSVDDLVDRVMRRLSDTGELDNTLVFFLSDNGYAWGEHRHVGKFVPYTESIKVPFVVRWPGHLAAGTVDDRMVATIDIKPTVLAAAGIPLRDGDVVDGRSLLDGGRRQRLLAEYWLDQANAPGIRDWAALRTPAWQYIEDYDQPGGATFREFYDLTSDPGMERNLLADHDPANDPPAGIQAELAAARACKGADCP